MKIYIIANFTRLLDGEIENRFSYLAEHFALRGHDVKLIITDFYHATKSPRQVPRTDKYHFEIIQCHEPGYKTNVSLQRLFSHYIWGKNVEHYLHTTNTPDVIYCAIPSLTASVKSAKFCRRNNIKFVVDLQDLWPESFEMAVKNKILQKGFLPMKWYVDKAYAAADLAIAVSDTYVDRILQVNHKLKSGVSVFLGNNGNQFDEGRSQYHLERSENELVIGYIGTMSTSYDIPCVFDALTKVQKRGKVKKPIRFVLIGGGSDEDKFKEYGKNTYTNHIFLERKPYNEMAGLLCDCDIVINPIVKGSVASIINKVGDYAMSGKPVINTQESPEYRKLVDDYQCGINCECGNSDEVADAIEKLAHNENLREQMGKNAIKLAKEKFDRRYTYQKIIEAVELLIINKENEE